MSSRIAAKVSHELHSCLCDVGHRVLLGVNSAVIALVRLGETRKFAVVPVELAAVNNNAAYLNSVAVHIF